MQLQGKSLAIFGGLRKLRVKRTAKPAIESSRRRPRGLALEQLEGRQLLAANPVITEFVAGDSTLADGEVPPVLQDWVEVYNAGDAPVDLAGWHLTDAASNLAKWTFPAKSLAAGEFLVVFASGNDAPDAGGNLHTNFKLSNSGEYLALVRPDLSIATEFSSDGENYPPQRDGASYGTTQQLTTTTLLGPDSLGKFLVQSSDGGLGTTWTNPAFSDTAWQSVETGVGFKPLSSAPGGSTTAVLNPIDGHYLQTVSTGMTWTAARASAQTLSLGGVAGHLATIRSAAENAAVLARATGGGWIGAHDSTVEGNWEWVDSPGSAFCVGNGSCSAQNGAYTNWNGGEPNDANGEDYAQIISGSGLWNDLPNTSSLPSVVEFDTNPAGMFTVRQVNSTSGAFADMDAALALLAANTNSGEATAAYAAIDFGDPQASAGGHYASTTPYPLNTTAADDYFAIQATGTVEIPTAGNWTFGLSHDDNARLTIRGPNGFQVIRDSASCCGDDVFAMNLPVAGFYEVELVHFENTGNSGVELFAAQGTQASFNANFKLIGDVQNGGLALSAFGNLISSDVGGTMRNVNASGLLRNTFEVADPAAFNSLTLKMAYDDGFVAYLNGTEVARRNAPANVAWDSAATASRTDAQVGAVESINLTPYLNLLTSGTNVLAIQGLNRTAADADFLISPEIEAASVALGAQRFFAQPTPGAFNSSAGVLDFVENVQFSQEHGFYDQPFQLVLSTPTAGTTIRYTTNGDAPTAATGTAYTGPITIGSTTAIRAAAFRNDFQPSEVATSTYLFLNDIVSQSANGTAPAGWPASWGSNTVNYGMDPDVVGPNDLYNNLYENTIKDDLKSIPTWSIVVDLDDMFGSQGIYANPGGEGKAWERPASFEVIDPSGEQEGFQANGGIRIRGGFSRTTGNPKHSFRLFFRDEYGESKLDYPLFGDEGVTEFDTFDLRTSQNYSWAFQGDGNNIMNRDVWSRDTQAAMGEPYTRSRYYHLYINGQYWGLYQTQERSEADYAASYFGGEEEDYDVLKAEAGPYQTVATDGNMNAAAAFYDMFTTQLAAATTDAQKLNLFMKMQGLNPDGTANPAYPKYLDTNNLIDYMLVIFYTGNDDGPILGGGGGVNNFFTIFNREHPDGFKFFAHDNEHTLANAGADRTGPYNNIGGLNLFNPQYIFQQLSQIPEFRLHVADRIHEHYFNDGALTTQQAIARFLSRKAEIDRAIVGESARWGDAKRATPFTRDIEWVNAINNTVNNFFTPRGAIALNQLIADNLYSTVEPPEFLVDGHRQHGGTVDAGAELGVILGTGSQQYNDTVLLQPNASLKYLVPTSSAVDGLWYQPGFDASAWTNGTFGIGFDTAPSFLPYITTNVQAQMYNQRTSLYMRSEFTLNGTEDYDRLLLRLKYEDGFVAYLNGVKVADGMAPGSVAWNSTATGARDETAAVNFTDIDLSPFMNLLHAGTNVLAIQGLNVNTGSTDLLFVPELRGGVLIPSGTSKPVYYTTDGSDPRLPGGGISPAATLFNSAFPLDGSTRVLARTLDAGKWSPLTDASYTVQAEIRVTEINYNPAADPNGVYTADNFEFIEIQNVGASARSLDGLQFVDGVQFDFSGGSIASLALGERAVVVKNVAAFQARYGADRPIAGVFTGSLANEGEQITLVDSFNSDGSQPTVVQSFSYDDDWVAATDGNGFSLVVINPSAALSTWDLATSWRASDHLHGSPGSGDAGIAPAAGAIVVNELLTHTSGATGDRIELLNTTTAPIDVSGWYLSDDVANLTKYRLPTLPPIAAGGMLVLNETETFGTSFDLSPQGGTLIVQAADAGGAPTGFQLQRSFGGAALEASFGRYTRSDGGSDFVAQTANTFGSANAAPAVGPLVMSEINYNPSLGQYEFIEIHNPTAGPISLAGWQFSAGIEFAFPAISIPAGGFVVVSETTEAAFRAAHNVPAGAVVLGPWTGALDNGGEEVRLARTGELGQIIVADRVDYETAAPWPQLPDGTGPSLARFSMPAYGNEPATWSTGVPGGTPGAVNLYFDESPPSTPLGAQWTPTAQGAIRLTWSPSTDAQSGVVSYAIYRNGVQIGMSATTDYTDSTAAVGVAYSYTIAANNGSGVSSAQSAPLAARLLGLSSAAKVDDTHIRVTFTEALTPAAAQTLANYLVGGLGLTGAALEAGGTTVLLTTAGTVAEGQPYRVTVHAMTAAGGAIMAPEQHTIFAPGFGAGLLGTYYDNMDFTNLKLTRTDPNLNFSWGAGSPDPLIGAETFSARWTGKIRPAFTETYTIQTLTSDGVRIWIDTDNDGLFEDIPSELVINNFTTHTLFADVGTVALVAERQYNIRVDYFENTGTASMRMFWTSPSQPSEVVPTTRLLTPSSLETVAPIATGLWVSGSSWTNEFNNNLIATGVATANGIAAPLGGATGVLPWAGVDRITAQFDSDVLLNAQSLVVSGVNDANFAVAGFDYDYANFRATWTLAEPVNLDRATITLQPTITDLASNPLGGARSSVLRVLPGDLDGDGDIDAHDAVVSATQRSFTQIGNPNYLAAFDVDGNGVLNLTDTILIRDRIGSTLPPGSPAAPAAVVQSVSRSASAATGARSGGESVGVAVGARIRLPQLAARRARPIVQAAAVDEALNASERFGSELMARRMRRS
jgi:hypothetical protein